MFEYYELNQLLNEYQEENVIIVLKGYKLNQIISMEILLKNKFKYFGSIVDTIKVISYDEYLALHDFILQQYREVIIIENKIYNSLFPVVVDIPNEIKEALLLHFDSEKNIGDEPSIDLQEYLKIYSGFIKDEGRYYVAYSEYSRDEKERIISPLKVAVNHEEFLIHTFEEDDDIYYLGDEISYLRFLEVVSTQSMWNINIKNSTMPETVLKNKLLLIKDYYEGKVQFKIGSVPKKVNEEINPEYLDILKMYWGKDSFRMLKMYNEGLLEQGEKKLEEISQGQIITDIITQVECAINGKDYKDIFVTAPTGAGKSVMFQIPAIYLAEKYELFTIVISPLIGLMKDQVDNLERRNYPYVRTINSEISPIEKDDIIREIENKECHILYLSPESLLGKSDLDAIIGNRKLGLFVIDEAHIVTTWGKQFRPDYWYLGDYINKARKSQLEKKQLNFTIATFTATAIYGGVEDMYQETVQSLKLRGPNTYLGYIKRDDIDIRISIKPKQDRREHELDKMKWLVREIERSLTYGKKMLIYFPTVKILERFYDFCELENLGSFVTKYHGQLDGLRKTMNCESFRSGKKLVMLATKAFGMGIDIEDIKVVSHYAPTGSVCDYVQEIGRAARQQGLEGEAIYCFETGDFKHINTLHGLSTLKEYQLIEVIKKIYELYLDQRSRTNGNKKKNEMLVDAECFTYIFDNGLSSEEDQINKVKTALLMIQKDFESVYPFSPFVVRPIPLFKDGYFKIEPKIQKKIERQYGNVLSVDSISNNICSVDLKIIWEKEFSQKFSFPKFKYLLYSRDQSLEFKYLNDFTPALHVNVYFKDNYLDRYEKMMDALKGIIEEAIQSESYYTVKQLGAKLTERVDLLPQQSESIIDIFLSALKKYSEDYCRGGKIYDIRISKEKGVAYRFTYDSKRFLKFIDKRFIYIQNHIENETLYLINDKRMTVNSFKDYMIVLGILEAFNILTFKSLGGKNSQIYIYVNQTQILKRIIGKPGTYKNKLVQSVAERHYMSVEMLTFLFKNDFSSQEIWDYLEDYFLGAIPKEVMTAYTKRTGKVPKINNII